MKKLFPLLVIVAGAVAYNVYKNRKETIEKEDKTLFVIDDSDADTNHDEPVAEPQDETVEEEVKLENEINTDDIEDTVLEETIAEAEQPMDEIVEAMNEVQQELGVFETLSDPDEPFERPSFFHMTDDSHIESEEEPVTEFVSTVIVEDDSDEVTEEVQEEILSTIVVEDTDEELEVEIELFLEEPLDIDEVAEIAEEVEEQILATILVEDEDDFVKDTVEEQQEESYETADEEAIEEVPSETIEESYVEAPEEAEIQEETSETTVEETMKEVPAVTVVEEEPAESQGEPEKEENVEETVETLEEAVEEFSEQEIVEAIEEAIEEIAEQIEEKIEEPVFIEAPEDEEELEPLQSYNTPEIDELMKTIAGQVKAADQTADEEEPEAQPEEIEEELPAVEETDYLQDIRKITEMYSEKVAQYNIRYPYLSSRFVDDTLKFSNQFNTEYPIGTRVAIEHHMHFDAVEDLFVFAQIIRQSGYLVKEGAEDKTLIVVREMFVDNNTILHDVFKVANQVYCLSGEYQKFRITKR